MKKLLLMVSCAALLAQQPDPNSVFRANSNLVIVNVAVRGKDGKTLTGLKKENFTLLENGKAQAITVFDFESLAGGALPADAVEAGAPNVPRAAPVGLPTSSVRFQDRRLMVLFFDLASLPPADQIRALQAATKFVKEQMTPADLVQIMSYATKVRVDQEFTTDRDLLLKTLQRFQLGEGSERAALGGTPDSSDGDDPNGGFTADDTEFNIFNTDLKLSALESAARTLAPIPEKKAMIYFSSGVSKTGVENESQLRATINAAVRANVSFYTIDVRGLTALPPGADATTSGPRGTGIYTGAAQTRQRDSFNGSQETLSTLASDTGGKAALDNNDLTMGIKAAQEDIQSYYLLGYYSTNTELDGRYRRIQVKLVGAPQAKLDYRLGYYGQKQFRKYSPSEKDQQLADALLLGDPVTDLPLALEVNYFRLGKGKYFVPIAVKIPGTALPLAKKGKVEATSLDVIGQILDAKGVRVSNVSDNIPIKLQENAAGSLAQKSLVYDTGFTLAPGKYTLKLLVRENQSGKMGTFETKFLIPDLGPEKDKLEISSVVWANQREPISAAVGSADKSKKQFDNHPLVQDGQKLVPSITHVFRRDQNLYVYLEVYDPGTNSDAAQPSVAATLSFFEGKRKTFESAPVRLRGAPAKRAGVAPLQFQVPLKDLKPGEYVCQVNVIDEIGKKFAFPRSRVVLLP